MWKRHPLGGLIGLGTSPLRIIGVRAARGSGTGTAASQLLCCSAAFASTNVTTTSYIIDNREGLSASTD